MARNDNTHDVQTLSGAEMSVYEAVASLAVDGRVASVADVARMTDRPDADVRRSLAVLVEEGWLVEREDGYGLGPHDWEVDY